ncbi:MAG: TetM/TetW/TetO/TetS family tetracycline resistance ribosomal protection protein [Bacilli bacterium]|nr:TetM/TetW/TetO/TetS family tetracycline resistance ribosomal protection protein [Bacilli bacterium]
MEKKVMTLGVFAHANAGKTTITEQLLYHTNVKKKTGRVDHGDTTTDNLKVEQDRGITVRSSMVTMPLDDRIIQLIDTPGHVDFSAEVERAISVLDGAILVVSGVERVEPQTQVIWKILQERKVPTIIFVNKMDRMGADYDKTIREMQTKLNINILPIVNVKKNIQTNELSYEDVKIENIIEELANVDDHILEKYINEDKISRDWLYDKVKELSYSGNLHFVYGGSALNDDGMLRLIDGIKEFLPTASKKKTDEFSGYVYTVKRDNGVRELYVKVLDGELENRKEFVDLEGNKQRIRTLTYLDGDKRVRKDKLETGEIGIVTGLDYKCGQVIGAPQPDFKSTSFVNPLFHVTVSVEDKAKIPELVNALEALNDEDPDLHLQFDKFTNEISIDLMGPLQTEIIDNLLNERFGIKADFSKPIIIHKETPISIGKGMATFDRVSGVEFEIKPLPRGSGLKYESHFSTDYLFTKYQKQIERLVYMYAQQGLYGWQITDAQINLIGGKSDSVCSDPSHFNIAVPLALMRSIKDAGMQLLEPLMDYEVSTPNDSFRKVLAALSNLGLKYEQINDNGENTILPGTAPLSEMLELPTTITRLTGGHGSMIKKPAGYELKGTNEILEKRYIGPDPRNEEMFAMEMNSSIDHIDRVKRR